MSEETMVVIVTGANRGIGKGICELILKNQSQVQLVATSRAGADIGFAASGQQKVIYQKLDVAAPNSVKSFANDVQSQFPDGIDILINNAGLNTLPKHNPESVKQMMDLNFRGTLNMCQTFLPQIRENGRIVNLSSTASGLKIYSKQVAEHFRNISTVEEAEATAKKYESLVKTGKEMEEGFGGNGHGYSVTKALVNAFTKILAASGEAESKNVLINCCCPGWVDTDMGNIVGNAPKRPIDGAKIPVKLAFGDIKETGKYWANDSISSTADGKVQPW